MAELSVFDYMDAKAFLRDLYTATKEKDSGFTYRKIAESAGMKSAGQLVNVLRGDDNIAVNKILKLATAFRLGKVETEYFTALVHYNRSKTHEDKKKHFNALYELKKNKVTSLDLSQYEYFKEWYYVAIHQLLDFFLFKDNYSELAKKLVPQITVSQAKKAIKLLESVKLIQKNPDGYYVKTGSTLTTGPWKSMAVTDFQLATIELAKKSVEETRLEERSLSTMTLSISRNSYDKIRDEIKLLRTKIAELAQKDEHADGVYQVNFHMFPMTKPGKIDKKSEG